MAKKYVFAIDETGCFAIKNDTRSFACGVLINGNEFKLRQSYQKMYEDFGFSAPIPTTIEGLLKTKDSIDDNARFHFNRLTKEQCEICKKHLLQYVEKVYVSKDKPVLYANNQNWWLIAITVIIREFLRDLKLQKDDEVEIWIDNRNEKVLGIDNDQDQVAFKDYHNIINQQIKNNVKDYIQFSNNLKIEFRSDTSSFFINLADIVCGFVRKDKDVLKNKIEECSCKNFDSGLDPVSYKFKNPLLAIGIIYQEIDTDKFDNISHVQNILTGLRNDSEDYEMAWDMFYDFMKNEIEDRKTISKLVKILSFVEIFFKEFCTMAKLRLSAGKSLSLMVLFVEYYSHVGCTKNPFNRNEFIEILKHCDKNTETRTLRKWEKLVSYTLRESQIYFNNYDFLSAKDNLGKVWTKHEELMNVLGDILYEKDEPTSALIGTLAQSYAYKEELNEAIEYFNLSKDYSIKSTNKTDSYLFTIYHRKKDVMKARDCFVDQCGMTPEEYYNKGKYNDVWKLLSYFKLRALELYKNGNTTLPNIEITIGPNYSCEYPFPLVMKWSAVALYLEDKSANKANVERLLEDAIENLLRAENGFTIKTLALPIIQCYSLINNQNQYHAKYNTFIQELKKQSSSFLKYVEEKMPELNTIKNSKDLWEKAMLLPFIYA